MAAAYGLDKFSGTATLNAEFRGQVWSIGSKFKVVRITIPLDETIQTNCTIVCKLFTDSNLTTPAQTLSTLNTTNFSGATSVTFKRPEINVIGKDNLCLALTFTGTRATAVKFPIEVEIETYGDQPRSI